MKILHLNKNKYLALEELNEYYNDGFYDVIDPREKERLNYFLQSSEDSININNLRITEKKIYEKLPYSINAHEWKTEQQDAKIIDKLIKDKKSLNKKGTILFTGLSFYKNSSLIQEKFE